MPGTLYLVATPIGNLEDITLRALRVLREASLVAAEDTRRTHGLLQHYQITRPLLSLHDHNERQRTPALLARLRSGESVALVSDAGTPLISDPGLHLVREALAQGIKVAAVPGPSALTTALSVSGISLNEFTFVGFPPARGAARDRWLAGLAAEPRTLVLFETPHRIHATLEALHRQLGDRSVVIARELTKLHETLYRGRLSVILAQGVEPRGEFVLLVEPPTKQASAERRTIDVDMLSAEFGYLTNNRGFTGREAAETIAARHGVSRQAVFKAAKESEK